MDEHLDLFERLLESRDHLMGDELSAADLAACPVLKYTRSREAVDDEPVHRILDDHQTLGDGRPRLAGWIDRMDHLPRA